jgi:hypothetical protein
MSFFNLFPNYSKVGIDKEEYECPICFETDTRMIHAQCNHSYCYGCYELLTDCAICRRKIKKRPKKYVSSILSILAENRKRKRIAKINRWLAEYR